MAQGVDLLGDDALHRGGARHAVEDHDAGLPSHLDVELAGAQEAIGGCDWWYESWLTRSSRSSSPVRPKTPERCTMRVVVTTRLVANQRTSRATNHNAEHATRTSNR